MFMLVLLLTKGQVLAKYLPCRLFSGKEEQNQSFREQGVNLNLNIYDLCLLITYIAFMFVAFTLRVNAKSHNGHQFGFVSVYNDAIESVL